MWVATDAGVAMLYANGTVAATHGYADGLTTDGVTPLATRRIVADESSGTIWALGVTEGTQTDTLFFLESGFGAGGGELLVR